MRDYGLDLAVIGNGRTAALVDPDARIVWWCFPRFDGDPIFCRLLSGDEEKGFSDVVLDQMVDQQSEYLRNTAVVSTVLTDARGGAVRVTDFAPRFPRFGRMFRPPQLVRIIEPLAGLQLRRADPASFDRQQSHSLFRREPRHPAHHGCSAVLHRAGIPVRADPAGAPRIRRR